MSRPIRAFPASFVSFLWIALCGAAAPAVQVALDAPIELPKYEVSETRIPPPPESWRYAAIPGFEILSNASRRNTDVFVQDFQLLQQVIAVIWPTAQRLGPGGPVLLVLCGRGNSFESFLGRAVKQEAGWRNSAFYEDSELSAIVVDFAATELLTDQGREEADPFRSFRLEYFRYLIRRSVRNPPAWFEEGMVQMAAAVDYTREWIEFGKVGDGFGNLDPLGFNAILARRAILPMQRLFDGTGAGQERRVWQAQCYAFVHRCLYGMNGDLQKQFIKFLDRSQREPVTESLFKQCFGRGYEDFAIELRGYVEFTVYKYSQYSAKKGQAFAKPEAVRQRDATDAEVGRIKGEVMRLAGQREEAKLALIAPYLRGEREPQLLAALGLYELEVGQQVRARKFLEAAFKAGSVRASANLALARLRWDEIRAVEGDFRPAAAQVESVLAPLQRMATQRHRLPEIYDLAAEVVLASGAEPSPVQLGFVLEGASRNGNRPRLLHLVAQLCLRAKRHHDARMLVEHALRLVKDPPSREAFLELQKALPEEPPVVVVEPGP